jgi:hypothetical protein
MASEFSGMTPIPVCSAGPNWERCLEVGCSVKEVRLKSQRPEMLKKNDQNFPKITQY